MASLFDVDIGNVDPLILDTDSEEVYLDPEFRRLSELRDEDIISSVRDRLNNRSSLVVGRLPAMLFLLNTPASCRVLVRADFISIRNLLFSSWRPLLSLSWDPSDENLRTVMTNSLFKTLMFLDSDILAGDIEGIGVDPRRISKFAAILLLLNTTSSWVLLGSADDNSVVAAAHSEYATERRINTLRQELDRLERPISLLKGAGEESVSHLPIELVRTIVLNTHDIARLSELQNISSIYARVLDEPEILQQLIEWWRDNGEPLDTPGSLQEHDVDIKNFRDFKKWVVDTFYTSLCYTGENRKKCFEKIIATDDIEMWEDIEKNMSLLEAFGVLSGVYWQLVENDSSRIAQYVINNKMEILDLIAGGVIFWDDIEMIYLLTIAFGTVDDLIELMNYEHPGREQEYIKSILYNYLLVRGNYDRDITRILLGTLANDLTEGRFFRGSHGSSHRTSWIPELIEDLENGYYPFYPNLPSIQTHKDSQRYTNYWLYYTVGFRNMARMTLADYLRQIP